MNEIIVNKYNIINTLSQGTFGNIYKGSHRITNNLVAIKTETNTTQFPLLKHETTILKYLHDKNTRNIPLVYWFGIVNHKRCLVMPLYDCSLHDYIQEKSLTDTKINTIMTTMISILQSIHDNLVIHRDIKPQNIMLRQGELFIIDFGFATFYIDENCKHIPDKESTSIIGTPKYVSFHIHCGSLPTRRDDLISLGYMYMFLHLNSLPWDKIVVDCSDTEYDETHILNPKNKEFAKLKHYNSIETTFINTNFTKFLNYCYYLDYDDTPCYSILLSLFSF